MMTQQFNTKLKGKLVLTDSYHADKTLQKEKSRPADRTAQAADKRNFKAIVADGEGKVNGAALWVWARL